MVYISQHKTAIHILCLVTALGGFIIDTLMFYPGFISPDSMDQYIQASTNAYGDWHPPIMAGLWSLLLHIYNGPQPMLFLQLFFFWASFYLVFFIFLQRYSWLPVLIPLLFFSPFFQNFAGNIWKDVHLALAWLLACAIMLSVMYQKRKMGRAESIASLLLICYGCWVRSNAFPGVLPLVAFWISLSSASENNRFSLRPLFLAKTLLVTVVILLVQTGLNRLVLKAGKNYIEYKLFAHDLTGIYVKSGALCFPDFVKQYPGFDTAYIRKKYDCTTFDNIWWNSDHKGILPDVNDSLIKVMRSAWMNAIVQHPRAYAAHKLPGFLSFLRIRDSGSNLCVLYAATTPNKFGFSYTPNELGRSFATQIIKRIDAIYFKPWFWLILNVVLLGLAFLTSLKAIRPALLSLLLSSLFYLAFEFLVFPADTEFRYFYWNCIAISIAGLFAFAEFLRSHRAKIRSAN